MFAISLVLVVVISSVVLLYQYRSGTLLPREGEPQVPEAGQPRDDAMTPARAA